MVGPGLLAQILVSKYEYHQPLYRQEKMFRQQFGVELSRKTMGCWVEQAAELLKPVYRAIREDLLRGQLPASRRDADPVFGPGCERQKPAGLSLGLQPARRGCAV